MGPSFLPGDHEEDEALHEGEMKFLPFVKLLNDINLDKKVILAPNTYLVKHHPNKDFIAVVAYYITTGSLPADYSFLIKSYLAFLRKIERLFFFYWSSNNQ